MQSFCYRVCCCVTWVDQRCIVELCRLGGKAVRIKKNHSSGSLIHNHKLFCGDMLSFIQVDPRLFLLIILFSLLVFHCFTHCCVRLVQASGQQVPVIVQSCICFINLHGKYSVRAKDTFRHCYMCLAASKQQLSNSPLQLHLVVMSE